MQVDESIRVDRGRLPPIQEFANEVPKLECDQIIDLFAFWQTGEIEFAEGRLTACEILNCRGCTQSEWP